MNSNILLKIPNQETIINDEYKVYQKDVEEMTTLIKNWYQLQPHLPQNLGK